MLKKKIKCGFLLASLFLFTGCNTDDIVVSPTHLLSGFVDLLRSKQVCGTYDYLTFKGTEQCGHSKDAFGFHYKNEHMVRILMGPSDDKEEANFAIPNWTLSFDTKHLKKGVNLKSENLSAHCSVYKALGEVTRHKIFTTDVTLEVTSDVVDLEHGVLDDTKVVKVRWEVKCPQFKMKASGEDYIELDLGPIPAKFDFQLHGTPKDYVK